MFKIIDSQGRIFGHLNIIDFFVILFLIFLFPLGYYGYQTLTKASYIMTHFPTTSFEVLVPCLFDHLTPDMLSKISEHDIEKDEQGNIIGEILTLKTPKPSSLFKVFGPISHTYKLYLYNTSFFDMESSLYLKVFTTKNKFAYYKNLTNLVKQGAPIEFKTNLYKLNCTILDYPE